MPTMDVALSAELPLRLSLDLGAVEAEVDLSGLSLRSVRYRTGASETRLRFGEPNPVACEQLVMAAGAAFLLVPARKPIGGQVAKATASPEP